MRGVEPTIARTVAFVATLAACGFHASGGERTDGPVSPVDARPEAPPDALELGPWGAPVLVGELSGSFNDDDPTLTADLLEIYFATTRAGDEDIWRATRPSAAVPFGPPAPVTELNSFNIDSNVEVSGDGLTITFTSSRGGDYDLWYSTRSARGQAWGTPRLLPGLNAAGAGEWGVVLSADRLSAVLCSDRGGDEALFTATRATAGDAFATPVEIAGIETAGDQCDGALPDPRTLYFTRNVAHGNPNLDLYVARWNGTTFGDAEPLATLNTGTRDSDPWVSPDQRTIYFSSNRPGGAGFDDIYMATR